MDDIDAYSQDLHMQYLLEQERNLMLRLATKSRSRNNGRNCTPSERAYYKAEGMLKHFNNSVLGANPYHPEKCEQAIMHPPKPSPVPGKPHIYLHHYSAKTLYWRVSHMPRPYTTERRALWDAAHEIRRQLNRRRDPDLNR